MKNIQSIIIKYELLKVFVCVLIGLLGMTMGSIVAIADPTPTPNPGEPTKDYAQKQAETEKVLNKYVQCQAEDENQSRNSILKLTPIGSSPDQVLGIIQDTLHGFCSRGYKKNFYTRAPMAPYKYIYLAGNILAVVAHDDSKQGFREDIVANWYFDANDHLINVTVKRQPTGL